MRQPLFILFVIGSALAAADEQQALLEPGRRFTAELKLNPGADAKLFVAAGFERAQMLLSAVMAQGQERDATAEDWTNLHRAMAGLIELNIQRGQLFTAAVMANMQSNFYR